ncbi:MAG: DUF4440 domain-containing protein [Phycisphaerae bacterium]|jgi:ketosteroid isomerase-like protein
MVITVLSVVGCATADRAGLREELLETDRRWSEVVRGHDVEAIAMYWTDDAVIHTPGRPPVNGKDALRKFVAENRSTPGFSIHWKPTDAKVARSGDLAYTIGSYEVTFPKPDGGLVTQEGNYICVWRREGEAWRCELEVQAPLPGPKTSPD